MSSCEKEALQKDLNASIYQLTYLFGISRLFETADHMHVVTKDIFEVFVSFPVIIYIGKRVKPPRRVQKSMSHFSAVSICCWDALSTCTSIVCPHSVNAIVFIRTWKSKIHVRNALSDSNICKFAYLELLQQQCDKSLRHQRPHALL